MPRKPPPVHLCCPSCLCELFRILETGQIVCAECGFEVRAKKDDKDVKIH